jgi:hypothetical protein
VDDSAPTTFWAGPALVASSDPAAGPAVAVLVLWRRSSTAAEPDAAVADALPTSAELIDRGFARLPAPTVEQLLALPHLTQAEVRLPAGGGLHIDDGPRTLLEGARYRASDDWHTAARAGRLALLVDVEPDPDTPEDEPETDLAARALAGLTAACRAGSVVGARVDLTTDDGPAPG